ncbi:hypothetical protein ACRQD2_09185 [Actinotignum sp. GS-2025e]|uniref:hypothetical protein n=1 Tax=Actinotignum TaxID=1653174 RepID=UPI00237E527E|nr:MULTISPECIES: hypothetical protein [Actinotignum]MDE1641780.1 hypothetical protein [Actinotignum sanguinis]MDE1654305.1 hypothetical protein [Actinotignum schaalii]
MMITDADRARARTTHRAGEMWTPRGRAIQTSAALIRASLGSIEATAGAITSSAARASCYDSVAAIRRHLAAILEDAQGLELAL